MWRVWLVLFIIGCGFMLAVAASVLEANYL
jgi:hypothetical protein